MNLKKLFAPVALILCATNASAGLRITEDGFYQIDWKAECSDCASFMGDTSFNPDVLQDVFGNITLNIYPEGEAFNFTTENFVALQYDGPSDHMDKMIIHNAAFSEEDTYTDTSDNILASVGMTSFPAQILLTQADNPFDANGYLNIAENMSVDGWISADRTSYSANIIFNTYVYSDFEGNYITASSLTEGQQVNVALKQFNIKFMSTGEWGILVTNRSEDLLVTEEPVLLDVGRNATLLVPGVTSATSVPEPSTFILFGLSLIGLAGRRYIKL